MPDNIPAQQSTPASPEAPTERGVLSVEQATAAWLARRESAAAPAPDTAPADGGGPEASSPSQVDSSDGVVEQVEPTEALPAEEVPGEDADTKDPVYLIEVDGEEREFTAKDLSEAVLRHEDYTRKTQVLAEQRRAVEQAAQQTQAQMQAIAAQQAEYAQRGQQYDAALQALAQLVNSADAEYTNIDWVAEYERDPIETQKKRLQFELHQQKKQAVQAEQQRRAEEHQQLLAQQLQQKRDALRQHVQAAYPQWQDEQVRNRDWSQMNNTAQTLGFSAEEVTATTDPRIFNLIYKAAQFDAIVAAQAGAKAGAQKPAVRGPAPEPIRIVRPGAPRPSARTERATEVAQIAARLRRTGSVDAAVDLWRAKAQNQPRR